MKALPALILLLAPALAAAQTPEGLWSRQSRLFDGTRVAMGSPGTPVGPGTTDEDDPLTLSELAGLLRRDPAAMDALVESLTGRLGETGRAWLTPERRRSLEDALRRADPRALDALPELTPSQLLAAASAYAARQGVKPHPAPPAVHELDLPGAPGAPAPGDFLKDLGHGLLYGDETAGPTGSVYGDAQALAKALNLLADNEPGAPTTTVRFVGAEFRDLKDLLLGLVAAGETLEVRDMRFYANFGDLHVGRPGASRDVMTPLWIATGLTLPSGKPLVVPVAHSHLAVVLRGPVNADLNFFFGIDGEAAFRADGTKDQAWVGGRVMRTWSGADAARLLSRAGDVRRALREKAEAENLPMGGYGPLGDCNDANAFITMEGGYPMLRDPRRYQGGGPLDILSRALPNDAVNAPDPGRILNSVPFDDLSQVPFPETRAAYRELAAARGALRPSAR